MRLLTTDRSLKKGRSYWDGWTVKSRHGVRVAATLGKESNSDCRSLSQRNTPGIFRPRFPQTIRTFYFSFTASPVSSLFFTYHNDVALSATEKNLANRKKMVKYLMAICIAKKCRETPGKICAFGYCL